MRNFVTETVAVILTATAGLTMCACAGSGTPAGDRAVVTETVPITSPTATLVVHGMSCPLCANNVDKQLADIPGVRSVSVDMGSGNVAVAFAEGSQVTRKDLADAIDRSGFTLAEIRVP